MFDIKIAENTIKGFNLGIFVIQFNPHEVNTPINEYGQTWLHLLAYNGNEFLAKSLIENKADLEAALQEMISYPGPFVLDVEVPYQEHVLPMIPSGRTVDDMILK